MKKVVIFLTICLSANLFAQQSEESYKENTALTIGILQGGGSLIGLDLEILLSKRLGIQAGTGLIGYGAGINYHLKPSLRSSFISLQYWHQGIGKGFVQDLIGPTFVYRGKRWLTFQAGWGALLNTGPAFPENTEVPPAMRLYSIGAYLPL